MKSNDSALIPEKEPRQKSRLLPLARRTLAWTGAVALAIACVLDIRLAINSGYSILYVSALVQVAAIAWLWIVGARPLSDNSSTLQTRTVEDMERLTAEMEDQNRLLRSSCHELTSAAREQKGRLDDLQLSTETLVCSLEGDDPDKQSEKLLRFIMTEFDAGTGAIWIWYPEERRMLLRTAMGAVAIPILQQQAITASESMQPSDIRKECCRSLLSVTQGYSNVEMEEAEANDTLVSMILRNRSDEPASRSTAPIQDTLVGVIALCTPRTGRFQPAIKERMKTLESSLSRAIDGLEQKRQLKRKNCEISSLHEMSKMVQNAMDMDQLYNGVLDVVGRLVHYENCTIFILEQDKNILAPRATRGRAVNLIDHIPFEHGRGISGWVAQKRKQLIIHDLSKEPGLLHVELIPQDIRSFISVPLIVEENVIGVINISHSKPYAFTPEDMQVLSILASQAAITIARSEMVRSLEQMAITDALTGLYNRRYFDMNLDNEIKRSNRYSTPMSLFIIDIDHFKRVNDTYGHGVGDMVLAETGLRIRKSLRETEVVARYGGEEFAVILPHTRIEEAAIAAERVRSVMESNRILIDESRSLHITISIGVGALLENDKDRSNLVERADLALYQAKQNGRNCIHFVAPNVSEA